MSNPLHGIRVLDVSRVLAGPYCAQIMADQGADVIKVESPQGDENRAWGRQARNGTSCTFNSVNRGKRGVTLNLKSEGGLSVLRMLVARADVVIQSFLPDTAQRLGVDYDSVKALNERIVYCAISGYGAKGPMREHPGYDLMLQAFTGIMSTTGYENQPPVRVGPSLIDMATGLCAYAGIVTALHDRERCGRGRSVHASLMETGVSLLGYHAVTWLETGVLPDKEGSGIGHLAPYQAFACRDGYLLTGATNDAAWRRFCRTLDVPALADDARFASNDTRLANRAALLAILEPIFASRPVAEWVAIFERHHMPAAPVQTLDQVLTHPQVIANDMVVCLGNGDDDGDGDGNGNGNSHHSDSDSDSDGHGHGHGHGHGEQLTLLGPPFKLSDSDNLATQSPPPLGAHTAQILKHELGMSEQQIEALRAGGAV